MTSKLRHNVFGFKRRAVATISICCTCLVAMLFVHALRSYHHHHHQPTKHKEQLFNVDTIIESFCTRVKYFTDTKLQKFHNVGRVFSVDESMSMLREAHEWASTRDGWYLINEKMNAPTNSAGTKSKHTFIEDLDVGPIENISTFCRNRIHNKVLPILAEVYGVPSSLLLLNDISLVRTEGGGVSAQLLRDYLHSGEFGVVVPLELLLPVTPAEEVASTSSQYALHATHAGLSEPVVGREMSGIAFTPRALDGLLASRLLPQVRYVLVAEVSLIYFGACQRQALSASTA